ncbi:C6orf211 [Cordylochernes scorpioides]|uniref:Sugar phosphate phosphatase n=1 Tax=Cordylochernes scorpioides TaxID=51811 RepID=A0ABY6KKY4_9ARAC|nr:C6orf211 [Cordylochernes scorpioides]
MKKHLESLSIVGIKPKSFAYRTVKDRMPVILTKVVDHLYRERREIARVYGEDAREEVKAVIGRLSKLRNEMQTNKPMLPLESSEEDVDLWNLYLEEQPEVPHWFESAWLYVECYMYRRIKEAFELRLICGDVCTQNSLWGNRCDLSLSAGEQIVSSRGTSDHILVDDWESVWSLLGSGESKKVGIVMDNAGPELAADLCLAVLLTESKLASHVEFHVKYLPWFVSDVTVPDYTHILETLADSESDILQDLAASCRSYLASGTWSLHYHMYWTLPHDMTAMADVSPDLHSQLSQLDLLIFKGDLNYRKLVGDLRWDTTTPFHRALRGFLPCPLVSLRATKADVIVGLAPGQADRLEILNPDWMTTGTYAVIQYAASL